MERKLITLKEACNYLGISRSHMYKLTSSKRIRHYKPSGKVIYFNVEDLNDYIKSSEVKSYDQINKILVEKYSK